MNIFNLPLAGHDGESDPGQLESSLRARAQLEKEGFAVVAASDGDQALVQYERTGPDLVVLDLMLPKMDGFEGCRTLRERERWAPVLLLTARDSVDDRVAGLESGEGGPTWACSVPTRFDMMTPQG